MAPLSYRRRLEIHAMSCIMVPAGSGFGDVIAGITEPGRIASAAAEAKEWTDNAIQLIRQAIDPNPFRQWTDEEICGEILRRVEERKAMKAKF